MVRLSRLAVAALAALTLASCGSVSTLENILTASTEPSGAVPPASGKVYVFRGMGGRIMSWEMDRIADKLNKSGIAAETYNHVNWRGPADEAIARYKSELRKSPIVLVGHSAGGDASIRFAERLKEANVPVSLIVAFDPTRFGDDVPPNVDRFINIWSSTNFFGGGNVQPDMKFRGHYASVDLRNYWEVLHVNLVKVHGLQDKVIAKIVQLMTLPPQLEGATVPIRYAPPRGEKIELWDSGLPVRAEAGDTVRSIAQKYAAPVWAVAQINRIGAGASLQPGQRLIVPRHLDPLAPGLNPPLTSFVGR
ncbi:MAG: LysM peptidoglycan-binding domain-containing protein [Pseudorhodoplanes sp.]|nr:hypothetical protein [Pseudorhodoplanes sp.]MBW7949826.1 LysM peptidoglycan-binding domain-containing protein [Pseudorhodoplanes sp.]MCL4713027.1 LysM peptidoglycan-binding domain-containing protein [Pseudorhodoplanes sp.]GIK82339.1 MAG: peptidoglycan-binding protein LysM [Alphaproteobacteria bacterium]